MVNVIKIFAVAALAIVVPALADGPLGSVPCTNAWSGATNTRPEYYDTPKDLADEGHLLDFTERGYLETWDQATYYWEEPDQPTDYIWLLFTFPDYGEEMVNAWVHWSFWVDVEHVDTDEETDRDNNKLLYWDGGEQVFVQIDMCDPDCIYRHNINAYEAWENNGDAENVTFLLYGYTPYYDETWAECDEASATVEFQDP